MSNIEQKLPCEVVQDILPLYHDGVCSGASRKMVENHLQECRTCKTLLQEMDETEMDMALADETKEVLEHHAKRERTLAYKTAVVIAGLLLLPIVIALLMTLPGYSGIYAISGRFYSSSTVIARKEAGKDHCGIDSCIDSFDFYCGNVF